MTTWTARTAEMLRWERMGTPGRSARPILRAPPFPGARPLGSPTRIVAEADNAHLAIDAIAAAIARHRVGGAFWASKRSGGSCIDPWPLFDGTRQVVADADEELALLAAAADTPVIDPASARTIDRDSLLAALHRRVTAFAYADPFSGRPIDVLRWIEILGEWRRTIEANRAIGPAFGIAPWKRRTIGRFLWTGQPRAAAPHAMSVWPSRVPPSKIARAQAAGIAVTRIEDGFLRSIGLGAMLTVPHSIVVDRAGIYFDPHAPSDLETLLATAVFDTALLARSAKLIATLNRHRITKYGSTDPAAVQLPPASRRVLVPGQVTDDQSVTLGGAGITDNLDLLRRVRAAEPDAFIAYRPHPDVVAGLRAGHVDRAAALDHADAFVAEGPIDALFAQVDAVHVLTSLSGFEALLRGREVVTHGQPFYAGWGLTRDLAPPVARRGRRLSLEALVAATLILYPRYLDPLTRLPCPPEVLVDRLARPGNAGAGMLQHLRAFQGRLALARRSLAEARA